MDLVFAAGIADSVSDTEVVASDPLFFIMAVIIVFAAMDAVVDLIISVKSHSKRYQKTYLAVSTGARFGNHRRRIGHIRHA